MSYRIRIESCENADEGFTFDHETLAGVLTTCISELGEYEYWDAPSLLETLAKAIRNHDAGEPPIAKQWDFSSPDDAYYVAFYEDSEDDDGTPIDVIWKRSEATTTYKTISIFMNGVFSGSGRLIDSKEDGYEIKDCGAQFCDDAAASEDVYGDIEEAINLGQKGIVVTLDGVKRSIVWSVVEPT